MLTVIGPLIVLIGLILPVLGSVAAAFGVTVGALFGIIAAVAAVVAALVIFWPQIKQFLDNVDLWFMTAFENAKNWVVTALTTIRDFITTTLENIKGFISTKLEEIKNAIKNKVSDWKQAGADLIMGLVQGVKDKAKALLDTVVNAIRSAYEAATAFLRGGSPSRLFMDLGADMMKGWEIGIDKGAINPKIAVENAAHGMVSAAIPSGRGGGGATVILQYAPVVSLADRYEAETKLVPYIESALRKIRR